ncbi:plasmid mobilization protein, partial [Streptococcus pneumoniae]|uniref:plasmid mobilization protein n=2 Tax=Bacilli TaxID=91061 RepID=UPI001D0C0F2E
SVNQNSSYFLSIYLVMEGISMPDQNHKKAKTININLTEAEYEKVKQLAEVRDLNPTAYTRLTALGNRIKPTVVYPADERIEELEKENQELKRQVMAGYGQYEVTREDFDNLEEQYYRYAGYVNTFKDFLQYIQNDAEYINLTGYKSDEKLKEEIRDIIKKLNNRE